MNLIGYKYHIATLVTPLCGEYTIGGANPDFSTFSDAANALNIAGIVCPVVFKVRNGTYNEQIELGTILGNNAINTITFESQSGDSSLAVLNYQSSNTIRDYSFSAHGVDYLTIKDLGILRTNGSYSVIIDNNSHHILLTNSKLGNIYSPPTSCDSIISITHNTTGSIDINSPDNIRASGIVISNNSINTSLNSIGTNYGVNLNYTKGAFVSENNIVSSITATANGGGCSSPSNYGILISNSEDVIATENTINSTSNHYFNNCIHNSYGFGVNNSINTTLSENNFTCLSNTANARSHAGNISTNSRLTKILNNIFNLNSNGSPGTGGSTIYGINIQSGNSSIIEGNNIAPTTNSTLKLQYGIYNQSDSTIIRNNTITKGILGIESNATSTEISNNNITDIQGIGIRLNSGSNQTIRANKIFEVYDGIGIIVNAPNSKIYNNYVQSQGTTISKGLSLQNNCSNSEITFNSINITGTDISNGIAFEIIVESDWL